MFASAERLSYFCGDCRLVPKAALQLATDDPTLDSDFNSMASLSSSLGLMFIILDGYTTIARIIMGS